MIAGMFYSFTLGEFLSKWEYAWRKPDTMPTAVVCDVQYDWAEHYNLPTTQTLAGFLPSKLDPAAAYAFKIELGLNGQCQLHWKPNHDSPWLGVDHQPTSPGFVILLQLPVAGGGKPAIIEPNISIMQAKYRGQVIGTNMRNIADAHLQDAKEVDEAMEWLRVSMETGSMPYTPIEDSVQEPGDWGRKVKMGTSANNGVFQLMEPRRSDTAKKFWALPEDLVKEHRDITTAVAHKVAEAKPSPNIRYKSVDPETARKAQQTAADKVSPTIPTSPRSSHSSSTSNSPSPSSFSSPVGAGGMLPKMAAHSSSSFRSPSPSLSSTTVRTTEKKKYGAVKAEAAIGSFACVHWSNLEEETGMQLLKITETTVKKDNENITVNDTVTGYIWGTQKKCTDSSSVKGSFFQDKKGSPNPVTVQCWSVLAYFSDLHQTKAKRNQLPAAAQRTVMSLHNDEGLFSLDFQQSNMGYPDT
jgi:hypothetical protein